MTLLICGLCGKKVHPILKRLDEPSSVKQGSTPDLQLPPIKHETAVLCDVCFSNPSKLEKKMKKYERGC